jgi:sarcosine oxidase delta subunit
MPDEKCPHCGGKLDTIAFGEYLARSVEKVINPFTLSASLFNHGVFLIKKVGGTVIGKNYHAHYVWQYTSCKRHVVTCPYCRKAMEVQLNLLWEPVTCRNCDKVFDAVLVYSKG